jgi:polyisoprenoid-binding protein YceI
VNKWLKRALIAVPVVIVLVYAAIFVYTKWINDPAPKLTIDDARELALGTDPATTDVVVVESAVPATTEAVPASTEATVTNAAAETTSAVPPSETDGVWTITSGSEFGYRVKEVLGGVDAEAVGRGEDITGSITIDGANVIEGTFEVQVGTIASDNGMRDGQFRGRVMETDEFPTASFELTEPIDFGKVPAVNGEVTTTATGNLTLHGVTQPVTFDVTAVRGPQRIAVVGSIPIVFGDYDIDNPSNSAVTTRDNGLLEFNLGFEQT